LPTTIVNFSFYVLCTCVAVNSIRNHFVTSRLLSSIFIHFLPRFEITRNTFLPHACFLCLFQKMRNFSQTPHHKKVLNLSLFFSPPHFILILSYLKLTLNFCWENFKCLPFQWKTIKLKKKWKSKRNSYDIVSMKKFPVPNFYK